jgi:hypothetical protein
VQRINALAERKWNSKAKSEKVDELASHRQVLHPHGYRRRHPPMLDLAEVIEETRVIVL